jgi:hypothetical protein
MQWYFVGRGGVLGDVEAPVVQSAFGYFAPAVVAKMWNGAREKIAPRDAAPTDEVPLHAVEAERLADPERLGREVEGGADRTDRTAGGLDEIAGSHGAGL